MPINNIILNGNVDPDADPYFSQLVFLQNWSGAAGAAAPTVEQSPLARAITNIGSVVQGGDNTVSFNGTSQALQMAALAASVLSGDYCIEGWVSAHSLSPDASFLSMGPLTANTDIKLEVTAGKAFAFFPDGSSTGLFYISPNDKVIDTMYHYAITRTGGVVRTRWNGVNVTGTPANVGNLATGSGRTTRLGNLEGQSLWFSGKLGPQRITKGTDRYGIANFTPPDFGPFPIR